MSGVTTATVLAGASLAVTAAGTAASMLSSGRSGAAAGQAAGANAAISQQNAQLAKERAAADAADIAVTNRKNLGSIRANAGANGLVVEDGSPLEAILDSAATGELNRQRRLWQGDVEARGFMVDAFGEELKGYQAQQKATAGIIGGAASLLSGGSKLAGLFTGGGGGNVPGGTRIAPFGGDLGGA